MHWLDTTILVLLAVGATFGAISGLLLQVARVAGLSVAVYAAVSLHEWATGALQEAVLQEADPRVTGALAYLLVFVVVYLAFHLSSLAAEKWLKAVKLQTMNRVLGGVLGAGKTAVVLGGIFLAMMYFPHPTTTDLLQKSAIAPVLANVTGTLVAVIPSEQVEDWRNGVDEWKSSLKTAQETRRVPGG
jgi:uncharacterized membrane protein required for colicin V production